MWIDLLVLVDLFPPLEVSIHIRFVELGRRRRRELWLGRFFRFLRLPTNTINPLSLRLQFHLGRSIRRPTSDSRGCGSPGRPTANGEVL